MIIRSDGDLLLIRQPDHARLAARIMTAWRADGLPASPRRPAILAAIGAHDDGWREPDASPIVDEATGGLLDFVHAPIAVRQGVWPRATDLLDSTPYEAALVAEHSIQIFDRFHADAAWRAFFDEMRRRRDGFLARAGEALDTLTHDYLFLRAGDLVSLAFCNGWTDEQRIGRYRIRLHGTRIVVAPDPFEGADVPLSVTARRLPARRYTDDSARLAFTGGPVEIVSGTTSGH